MQLGGEVHLLHQVKIVVASGGAVGTEADFQSRGQHLHHRRDAAREHHVARRAVSDGSAVGLQDRYVGVIRPDAVGGERGAVEHSQRLQLRRCALAPLR